MAQILADTNVCLRLADESAAAHWIAATAVEKLLEQGHTVFLTSQVLIEFWAVATRPTEGNGLGFGTDRARTEVGKLLVRFPLLRDNPRVFRCWRALVGDFGIKGKRTHDARLAAVMEVHGVSNLLTFNGADFSSFPNVIVLDPSAVAAGQMPA